VLREVVEAAQAIGIEPVDVIASPIQGPEGNREFLLHLRVPPRGQGDEVSRLGGDRARPMPAPMAARIDAIAAGMAA
jgi:hypothetical protein